jgi:micrococcal nuclease
MKQVFLCFLLCATAVPVLSQVIDGVVVEVIDGNTIRIRDSQSQLYEVVFAGVDAPELTQPFGGEAKAFLSNLLLKQKVTADIQGKDRKGNYIAIVLLKKTDPRLELLKEGLLWTSEKDPIPLLEKHRVEAKEKSKGLWKEDNPTPPWIHRRQQSMMNPKSS